MPPKSKRRVEEDSDDAIVEESPKPKRKKTKVGKSSKRSSAGEDVPGGGLRDGDGAEYWEVCPFASNDWYIPSLEDLPADQSQQLSKNRRVTVNEFKGKYMVNLREYYLKDDEMLPGKKVCSPDVSELVGICVYHDLTENDRASLFPSTSSLLSYRFYLTSRPSSKTKVNSCHGPSTVKASVQRTALKDPRGSRRRRILRPRAMRRKLRMELLKNMRRRGRSNKAYERSDRYDGASQAE